MTLPLPPLTPEEWERKAASLREDARILQAEIDEQRANAEVLEQALTNAQALVDEALAGLDEAQEEDS